MTETTPLTYIDRDNAAWTVDEGEYEGQPVLRITVLEEGIKPKHAEQIVFHKDDADILIALIEQARDR